MLFGFTFIVWQRFVQQAVADGVKLRFPDDSILVHGGGWKRLLDQIRAFLKSERQTYHEDMKALTAWAYLTVEGKVAFERWGAT